MVREGVRPLGCVDVGVTDAVGMVLAEDVLSDIDMPPFDKSFRDGYAVRAVDIAEAPARLRIIGEVRAGGAFDGEVGPGEAVLIMTGAPIPKGADTVVMVEDTERISDGEVRIGIGMRPGSFIGLMGSDIAKGTKVLEKGRPIRHAEVAVLAACGRACVRVYKKPAVAVIVTGDELVSMEEVPQGSEIRDCNGPLLETMLTGDGFEVKNLGVVCDRPDLLKSSIEKGLGYDILLLSGGVSAGEYDYVPEILESLGVERVFHKVGQKPGKPLYFGRLGERAIFGMPGNPVSTFYCYKVFVRCALLRMMGYKVGGFKTEKGRLVGALADKSRRKAFIPVFVSDAGVRPVGWRGSADVFSLAESNAFAILPPEVTRLEAGAEVEFFRW